MTDLKNAAEMALEALEAIMFTKNVGSAHIIAKNARYSLREALAKGGQKPTLFFGRAVYFADPKTGEKLAQPEKKLIGWKDGEPQYIEQPEQEKLCVVCGKPTMHMGNKCYGCCQTAQPEQEPVAWNGWVLREVFFDDGYPLSHREPPKQWVGLTDEERDLIARDAAKNDWHDYIVISATEAVLRSKNNG